MDRKSGNWECNGFITASGIMSPGEEIPVAFRVLADSRNGVRAILFLAALLLAALPSSLHAAEAAKGVSQVKYSVGNWPETDRGNHRAVVRVSGNNGAVWVRVPWRRRDSSPERKDIRIYDATTGQRVLNVFRASIVQEFGDIVFQPATAPGEYHVYYLPCPTPGDWFAKDDYYPVENTAQAEWLNRNGLSGKTTLDSSDLAKFAKAEVVGIQAWSDFHRFDPMEIAATQSEVRSLVDQRPDAAYLLFPEDREHSIRMFEDLPLRWIERGPSGEFRGTARPGEYYVFQVGVFAARESIADVHLRFGALKAQDSKTIPATAFDSINLSGRDWLGREFKKEFAVGRGKVRPLWIGVQVPKDATGTYRGAVRFEPRRAVTGTGAESSLAAVDFGLELRVEGQVLDDAGEGDGWRLSRLRWLNSTMGLEDTVVAPYVPLQVDGDKIKILNREIVFGSAGFPSSIKSNGHEVLARAVALIVETSQGEVRWTAAGREVEKSNEALATQRWRSTSEGGIALDVESTTEFDGAITITARLTADRETEVKDIRMVAPVRAEVAQYMMGLGARGGRCPDKWEWKWDLGHANAFVWVGDMNAGLHVRLLHNKDVWSVSTFQEAGLPESWDNSGKGGCEVVKSGGETLLRAYSGPRHLGPGQSVQYRFRLLVTPFKPINPNHWNWRYSSRNPNLSAPAPLDIGEQGHAIAHVHHAIDCNPWINYPFLTWDGMKAYRDSLLSHGYKGTDFYYTVRELSTRACELWAFRSLGDEIYKTGGVDIYAPRTEPALRPAEGYSWLREHLVAGYVPAWKHPFGRDRVDCAIATQEISRLHNFYIQGLDWLLKKTGYDGLYLDGIGYDREIMKRVARVMSANNPAYRIKFHSGNNYDYMNWKSNVLGGYAEHLPYFTDLWIGEGFDYNQSPDYWFVEISGLPFGLTSELLDYGNGGNIWRAMLYGMGGRMHPSITHLWKLWDRFGIQEAQMTGYWDSACPVRTGRQDILATVYQRRDRTLVALASWAKEKTECELQIDWKALGLDPAKVSIRAPKIEGYQEEASFEVGQPIPVDIARGRLLWLAEQ